jgi:hypothetical protein
MNGPSQVRMERDLLNRLTVALTITIIPNTLVGISSIHC